ncbi:hypothetical protein V0288_22270 [Pannus brasiliensis CCIBt3594]|uniref:Uncharacterized protein n=1 Tax=Pannus brasiliensis CCIBt3594 TaxID=1427578 RepID=A0AAW9R1G4_9CHRO
MSSHDMPGGDASIGSIEKPGSVRGIGTLRSEFLLSIDDDPIALPLSVASGSAF